MRYELLVQDFWTGVVLGRTGAFGTVKQATNEALDMDCELMDDLLFTYQVVEIGTHKCYQATRNELIFLGQMMQAQNAFNVV